jgi:L-asparaginase II
MREHAVTASGSGRDVAALMRAVPGLLAKDGFEGVQVAALPDGRAIAVKIADGANRARVPVAAAALALAGVSPEPLSAFAGETLLGGGQPVGRVQPVAALTHP